MNFVIPDQEWVPDGDNADKDAAPETRMLAQISINGIPCHAEAIEVFQDERGGWNAVNPAFEFALDSFYGAAGADGPFMTTEIMGKTYVVFVTPHCQ